MSDIWFLSISLIVDAVLIMQTVSIFVDSCRKELLLSNTSWYIFFVFMLAFNCFLSGSLVGMRCERKQAIKSEVAHYVTDGSGDLKFEYIKK